MEANTDQLNRLRRNWNEYAQEPVTVEQISGVFYGYGSELACLRIYRKYSGARNTEVKYSENRKTWFFRLEPRF